MAMLRERPQCKIKADGHFPLHMKKKHKVLLLTHIIKNKVKKQQQQQQN